MTIQFTPEAASQRRRLGGAKLDQVLNQVQASPFAAKSLVYRKDNHGRVVKFHLKGGGEYRLAYVVDSAREVINVCYIGPRENAYRDIRRRSRRL